MQIFNVEGHDLPPPDSLKDVFGLKLTGHLTVKDTGRGQSAGAETAGDEQGNLAVRGRLAGGDADFFPDIADDFP